MRPPPRLLPIAAAALATFTLTRLLDTLTTPSPAPTSRANVVVRPLPDGWSPPQPPSLAPRNASASPPRRSDYFIVIGIPIGVNERNRERRHLLRELWLPEYANIGRTVRVEFIVGLLTYQGEGHDEATVRGLHEEQARHGDLALLNAREATTDPYRGDPKNTGEKLVAWMRRAAVLYARTAYFVKADWDSWVHTVRLEHNLRRLSAAGEAPMYFGNTLWCSYSVRDFQPCGYGFGPLQAAGARKTECPLLPGGRDAVGPYPYAAGLFWGMSHPLVQWIASSRFVYDFAQNASARFSPPYWVKGEDSAFGFFAHIAPFKSTPIHWGWDVVHDGYDFRSKAERGLCTQHITNKSMVVHSMHTREDFLKVRRQLRERCDAECERAALPFDVTGLEDLCARNPNIPKVYSKCSLVGYAEASEAWPLKLPPRHRPSCHSVGEVVDFLATKEEGGTITCT
ncbi:hypothetical protein AB1Y20_021090 [Prymnesium parvum]|uniref:Hexosyltransferase n=1 Tax=Prymnesium parvum TaxID=97485 RepID=A0AB34JJ57_PRYPA